MRESAAVRRGLLLASAALCVAMAPALLDRLILLPLRTVLNPNEGWNAMHVAAWLAGRPLYPPPSGVVLNNYPPLSFAFTAALARLTGADLVVLGRAISLVSLLVTSAAAGIVVRLRTGSRLAGAMGGLLLLATFAIGYTGYVGMNDPQLLGHAIATLGLLVMVRRWSSDRAVFAGLVLLLLAGLVKQNLAALPLATLLAAAADDSRRGIRLLVAGAGLAAIACLGIVLLFGGDALASLLAPRQWKLLALAKNLGRSLPILMVPLAAVTAGWSLLERRGPDLLLLAYLVTALLLGAGFSAGAGVTFNIFFDAAIAACVVATIAMTRAARQLPMAASAVASSLPLGLAAGHLLLTPLTLSDLKYDLLEGRATQRAAEAAELVSRIRAVDGPVACEALVLCYWAGKPFSVDFFNARQAMLVGSAAGPNLVGLISSEQFGLLSLYDRDPSTRLTPPAPGEQEALDGHYHEVFRNGSGLLLAPRR